MRRKNVNRKDFPAELASIEDILNFSEQCFLNHSINAQLSKEYRLVIEEVTTKLIQNAPSDSCITVESSQRLDTVHLRLLCPGSPVVLQQENEEDFSGIILEDYQDYLNQSYFSGVNAIDFSSSSDFIRKWNLIAIVLAIVCAIPIHLFCSQEQIEAIEDGFMAPLTRFYSGCIQAIAAPVVFFALTTLIIRLQHKFDHDRQLFKTFANYLFSSLIAIGIGFVVVKFNPLNSITPDLSTLRDSAGISYSSIKDYIEMFTFTNLLEAFQIANPVPLLIISILAGIAASRIQGNEGKWVRKAVIGLNSLFARMLSIVYGTIPIFLFFAILPNLANDGFFFVFEVFLVVILFLPLAAMLFATYALRLRLSGVSPVQFFKDYREILKENYRIGSNIQAIPYNKRMLSRKTRMPSSALKDRLSLGAMVNMDGNCLVISAFALYMMRACGISLYPEFLLSFAILLILLSIGAPNQPGSFLVAMVFIMGMTGISKDLYDIVIITEAFLGTAYSFINSVGDIVTIVAGNAMREKVSK